MTNPTAQALESLECSDVAAERVSSELQKAAAAIRGGRFGVALHHVEMAQGSHTIMRTAARNALDAVAQEVAHAS